MITFPTMGRRRQVRAVGFEEDAVAGHPRQDCTQVAATRESDDPREGHMQPQIEGGSSFFVRSGETMDDTAGGEIGPPQDGEGLGPGLADMDYHGATPLGRIRQLRLEDLALRGPWREVVMEVEADFTDGDGLVEPGVIELGSHIRRVDSAGVVGMPADGSEDPRLGGSEATYLAPGLWCRSYVDDEFEIPQGLGCDGGTVVIEGLVGEVGMRIAPRHRLHDASFATSGRL